VCALPFTASGKPVGRFEFVVAAPGDQVDPSIDGQFVVYSGRGSTGDLDVFLYDLESLETRAIADGAGDQDSPDVYRSAATYRTPLGIFVELWLGNETIRQPRLPAGDGAASNPTLHSAVAAWEDRSGGDLDVRVNRYRQLAPEEYALEAAGGGRLVGDQHSPAAYDALVAYVDDSPADPSAGCDAAAARGAVFVHDSAAGHADRTRICCGKASGVAIGRDDAGYVVAVSRGELGNDEDIEVYDLGGQLLAALPVAGPQRNPHLAGDWVAFEDHSMAFPQVVVWRWKTPPGEPVLVFVPRPSETEQKLNDLALALRDEIRVVFEDTASPATERDIALYRLAVNPIPFDDQPNGWPPAPPQPAIPKAECGDPNAIVLATLDLARGTGKPQAGEAAIDVAPPLAPGDMPVLVCIHAERVSAAWVTLDDEAIATPSDFNPHVVDVEVPGDIAKGKGRVSGVIAGKPGAHLTVRVLADPAAVKAPAAAPGVRASRGDLRRPDGCGSAGASAAGSLAALALLLARRRQAR